MKTIIDKSTKVSKYLFEDDASVTLMDNIIVTPEFIVADMNSGNATLVEGVVAPDDWFGGKYVLDAGVWSVSSTWVEPTEETPAGS